MIKENIQVLRQIALITMIAVTMMACSSQESFEGGQNTLELDSEAITNGTAVKEKDVYGLSTVALYVNLPTRGGATRFLNFCTGTLIGKEIVLTAAHCFADFASELGVSVETLRPMVKVGFGLVVAKSPQDTRIQFRDVKTVAVHESYEVNSVITAEEEPMEDIALIRLSAPAPETAKAAAIPTSSASYLTKGKSITLVGFGLTDGLYRTSAVEMNRVNVKIDQPQLTTAQFTYSVVAGKGSCSGDSGGPAYIRNSSGKVFVIGITSWGDRYCQSIGAYTSVAAFVPWILQTARTMVAGN